MRQRLLSMCDSKTGPQSINFSGLDLAVVIPTMPRRAGVSYLSRVIASVKKELQVLGAEVFVFEKQGPGSVAEAEQIRQLPRPSKEHPEFQKAARPLRRTLGDPLAKVQWRS